MGFRIRIEPGGREFNAEPQETLLEAALRSGINIHYNCSNGSCGECLARVIDGRGDEREFHDYVISENERNQGAVLLCRTHAASDMVIEARTAETAADIPQQQLTAKITRLEPLSDAVMMLLLRTSRSRTLRFMAGQHVELRVADISIDLPIASCPCNGMLLQFHLWHGRDEPLLGWLQQQSRIGSEVQIDGPFGSFLLDEASSHAVVMVGIEAGFAPLKSLIEHYINLEKPQPLHLYRLGCSEHELYLGNLCQSWYDALDNFSYIPQLVESPAELLPQLSRIAGQLADPAQTDIYLAITEELAVAAQQAFITAGVPAGQIRVEHHRGIVSQEISPGAALH